MRNFFKNLGFILLLVTMVTTSNAQGNMRIVGGEDKQKVSFKLVNNLMVIPVSVNGQELSFILDSGASNTIIFGLTGIDSLALKNIEKVKLFGLGSGTPIEGILSENNKLEIGNIIGFGQRIYAISNDKFDLSTQMGETIHGIIGHNLFKDFVVSINYKRKQLVFYTPEKYKPPVSKRYKKFDLPLHHRKPYLNAKITLSDKSEHQVKLLIDSGNSDALWIFENADSGLEPQDVFFIDYLGEGLSGSVIGRRSKIHSFSIGDFVFKKPTTAFLDSVATQNASSHQYRQGSIGSLILQRFKVIIDYPNNRLYLKKTRSFKNEFRYNRAGIELAYAGKTIVETENIKSVKEDGDSNVINFQIVSKYSFEPVYSIRKVRYKSVAAKAGLKSGDILSKIKGKPAYRYTYKEIIGFFYDDFGTTIDMVVYRGGEEIEVSFKLEKLL